MLNCSIFVYILFNFCGIAQVFFPLDCDFPLCLFCYYLYFQGRLFNNWLHFCHSNNITIYIYALGGKGGFIGINSVSLFFKIFNCRFLVKNLYMFQFWHLTINCNVSLYCRIYCWLWSLTFEMQRYYSIVLVP